MSMLKISLSKLFYLYDKEPSRYKVGANEILIDILNKHNITDVKVGYIEGHLTDYYDYRTKTVYLSSSVYYSNSLAAITIAAHEFGHVLQDKQNNMLFRIQTLLSKLVNITSYATRIFIYIGVLIGHTDTLVIGFFCLSLSISFYLLNLPLEFNASQKALEELAQKGYIAEEQIRYSKRLLISAFLTHVYILIQSPIDTLWLFPRNKKPQY